MSNNPFQQLRNEYDATLSNIRQAEIQENKDPSNRSIEQNYQSSVNNFYKVKEEVAQLSNSMVNNEISLNIPQLKSYCENNKMYNVAYPELPNALRPLNQPTEQKPSLFVNDLFTGSGGGPVMNVLDMSNNYRSLTQGLQCSGNNNRSLSNASNINKCTNSSFSNRINQSQFRSGSDVVSMMADNGNVYQFDNGNRSNSPLCRIPASLNQYRDIPWVPQNLPTLTTMSKDAYVNNVLAQKQQQVECNQRQAMKRAQYYNYNNVQGGLPLNNPNNPVWKPLDSKYLN